MPPRRAPAKTSSRPRKTASAFDARSIGAPRLLSSEEKRELILAHAAARRTADPVQRFSLWAGVAICLVFIVGAWIYSVGSGIRESFAQSLDPSLTRSAELTKDFLSNPAQNGFQETNELGKRMKVVTDGIDQLNAQDEIVQELVSSTRLFQPQGSTPTHPTTLLTP